MAPGLEKNLGLMFARVGLPPLFTLGLAGSDAELHWTRSRQERRQLGAGGRTLGATTSLLKLELKTCSSPFQCSGKIKKQLHRYGFPVVDVCMLGLILEAMCLVCFNC